MEKNLIMSTHSKGDESSDEGDKIDPYEIISSYRRQRGTHKRKVTLYLKSLKESHDKKTLTASLCKVRIKEIDKEMKEISEWDHKINKIIEDYQVSVTDEAFINAELDDQASYNITTCLELDEYESYLNVPSGASSAGISADKVLDMMSKINMTEGKPPPLECGTFSGREKDKFAFNTFFNQFNNVIASRKNLSDSAKQTYLYGYLRDYALKVVKHLPISDTNYQLAVNMLKQEFLDVAYITDETFKNILRASPTVDFDPEFTSVKIYLNEVKAYLHDLKANNVNLLEEGTAGNKFVSHIIFNKLPFSIKKEMVHKALSNYPSLNFILENYNDVIKTLMKTSLVKKKVVNKPFNKTSTTFNGQFSKPKEAKGTMQNFGAVNTKLVKLRCKLCSSEGHTIGKCTNFLKYNDKLARLKELSLCSRCAGSGHNEDNCYGKQNKLRFECRNCKKKEHITPLCPLGESQSISKTSTNLCFAQTCFDGSYLLPSITLYLRNGSYRRKVRCLIDCCSQRSYISELAAKDLCEDVNKLYEMECEVSTCIGQKDKEFKQMSTGVEINGMFVFVPLLVDKSLNISFEVPGLNMTINKLKRNNIGLLDQSFYEEKNHDKMEVDMLLGIDIVQYMLSGTYLKVLGGTCFVLDNKVAPLGNVFNFLNEEERKLVMSSLNNSNARNSNDKIKTMVNLIMDPLKSYFNPLESILEDSDVDNGLEYLFSLESLGIKKDDKELISFDKEQIDKFNKGITFKDGFYHVELPWYSDKINLVPSNYFIALKVLDRTMFHLEKKGLVEKYQEVFDKQLADGIIEQIDVDPSDYNKFTWIPHRPVIKMEEQVTTKIRPVFNCSLKTHKELPSLNEAAYPGIDLMGSILKLIFYFRTNNLVMISDIKQAFLMVKLKEVADKNRFCFFWKRGDKLIAYRYKSIVFGYTSSPFILNYVMKHHAEQYPDDKCKEILSNNFYVDNLLITGNHLDDMRDLYNLAFDRMKEGGFTLRSWNSNSKELRNLMKSDNRLVEHTCEEDKVLGYRYNINDDTLKVAPCKIDSESNTKRTILSQTSKIFDPLGLVIPVTVRGRILIRKIWKLDVDWDDELPKEICNEMKLISRDFEMLSELKFPRQALNEKNSYGLHIFCDSSVEAYGFTAYALDQNNKSSFLFAKSKLAPLSKKKEHSVPTLELLGVILAFKCLATILEAYNGMQFQFININVDAQVVLSWLMTKEPKVKNKFIRNRVLEADCFKSEVSRQFNLPIFYHYVSSDNNPADLLTKGLSYSKYLDKMKFWLEGPEWLTNNFENWPQYPLLSIPPEHKPFISTYTSVQVNKVNTGIYNIDKYSDFENLINSTAILYKLSSSIKGWDPKVKALEYWIKIVQSECFKKEIEFLKHGINNENKVPPLVMNLNLFIDNKGIIRSRGRIAKCLYFNYDVHNPILLPKGHRFTSLFIKYCHSKVQHLGIGTTLNYLRGQGFWIAKGRAAVKTEISDCITCKKYNALAFKYPKFTDMPKHHMNLVKPFLHVGVDYTGHFWVKDDLTGNSTKMFILVFTCLNIRAVHFELLPDMSSKNFLLAFQRFCNIYTIPQYIYSDNAKQFLKGGCILEKSLQSEEFKAEMKRCNIKHVKIPLYSAWVGSAWERLIRVLKNCLYKVVGRSKLTYFEFLTSLSNIQLAINSRPLTYRSSTAGLEFITPNSFIKIHGNSSLILRDDENDMWVDDSSQPNLAKTLEIQEEIFENFKKLWYESYLLSLREHSRNLYRSQWENRIKVGDIVLIKAFNKPRPFWMMGRVLEVVIGFDGNIRSVKLKQGNGSVEYHSICNLYPLELSITHAIRADVTKPDSDGVENMNAILNNSNNSDLSNPHNKSVRPKRKATEKFHKMLKENIEYL